MTHIIHLGADNSSDRAATLGGTPSQPGPHGASTQYSSANSLPSGSIRSPVTALKSLNLAQAVLDGVAVVFGLFFLCALAGSLPLAVALMILGVL
jgi:hypothetical protein